MRKCPGCGFNNPDTRERCLKCSATLVSMPVPDGSAARLPRLPDFNFLAPLRRAVYFAMQKLRGGLADGVPYRYPWTAAYASLLLGAGQWYNHQRTKAVIFGIIQVALISWVVYTIKIPANDWIVLLAIFWHLYMMADGCIVAYRLNGDNPTFRHVAAVWFAMMFFLGITFSTLQLTAQAYLIAFLTTVRSEGMGTALQPGDKLFIVGWPLFFGNKPRPGSLVFYNPRSYALDHFTGLSTNTYVINEMNSFGVITGQSGDLLAVNEAGEIFVNGTSIPPRLLPIRPDGVPYVAQHHLAQEEHGIFISQGSQEGGIFGFLRGGAASTVPTPRQSQKSGLRLKDYNDTISVKDDEIYGIVLFCAYPPERRRWFGFGGGLWTDYPASYPPGTPGQRGGEVPTP